MGPQLSTHVLPRLLDALAVANGAHCRKISVPPQQVSQSRRNQNLESIQAPVGGTMSVPSPTTQRLRIEAATMRTAIVLLAQLVLCANALAATEYAVDGLPVGTQLDFGSASYREYKCNPSDQFEGLIWCQKSGTDKERRGPYSVAYSLLHSEDGSVSYINRSKEPAFLNAKEAELSIERYSRKFGDSPRIMKMPHRNGLPDGVIAVWGKVTLEPLDQESIKTLADGKSPKKGFLVDYLRNFTRSAKEGLPIYRIDGGPGFIWAASFDQKGRGTLRLAAVNVSGFSRPPAPMAAAEASGSAPAPMAAAEASGSAPALVAAVEGSGFSPPPPSVAVEIAASTDQEELSSKLNQTIEKLQADLAISTHKIAELERAKSDAERALEEAEHATRAAENAKQKVEQARIAEKRTSDALIAQLRADKVAAGAKTSRWEIALYGSVGGVLVVLTSSAIGFLINGGNASASKKPVEKRRRKSIEVSGSTLSPEIAISEAAFERDLEREVAAINGTQHNTVLGTEHRQSA
jgi:hypothetical protein